MRRLITAISILISCIASAWSQETDFANQLLQAEKQIFETRDSVQRNLLIHQKIKIYTDADSIGKPLMQEISRIDPKLLPDSLRTSFYWNAAIASFLNDETEQAIYYIDAYETTGSGASVGFAVLKYITLLHYDTAEARKVYIQLAQLDPALHCLQCISEAEQFELRHQKLKQYLSFVIPGSGLMLNGNVGKGGLSLLLNAASVCAIVYMAQNQLIINAVGWGSNLVGKFYAGNIRLTEKMILEKEKGIKNKLALSCELKIIEVFDKYPLEFK